MSSPATAAPIPPQSLEAETAWAAGLFEGEGSFALRKNGSVVLSLATTDLDVLERFRKAIQTGRISSQAAGRNGRTKRLWRVDVTETHEVLRVAALLYDHLGTRRRARADEVCGVIRQRIEEATHERACPDCGRAFRPPFTPNAKATRFCSRECERRNAGRRRWSRGRLRAGQIGIDV